MKPCQKEEGIIEMFISMVLQICGKTFLVKPLKEVYECFVNPASGNFAWLGIESAEVVLLNDFQWKASLIPWCEFLQVLEGDTRCIFQPQKIK